MSAPEGSVAERFAASLVAQRKRASLSQEELGFRSCLHRNEVGQLERGRRLARIDTLLKLAGALGCEPGELLGGMRWRSGFSERGSFELGPDGLDS
jgi:transcriptional regulator with XRE-family HTH domain